MDGVPRGAQPLGSGDHPGPEPQYGMEQNHLSHPNSSQEDYIRSNPGSFRKRVLSLRITSGPPKEKVKQGSERGEMGETLGCFHKSQPILSRFSVRSHTSLLIILVIRARPDREGTT